MGMIYVCLSSEILRIKCNDGIIIRPKIKSFFLVLLNQEKLFFSTKQIFNSNGAMVGEEKDRHN